MKKRIGKHKKFFYGLLCLCLLSSLVIIGINVYVKEVSKKYIILPEEASTLTDIDCILVLGCQVKDDGSPSDMLRDRLTRGIELYKNNTSFKLLMSGDHGSENYDEVGNMKQYAIDAGVSSSDIFMDHAGFSTYESIYRAKEIFGAKKILIVTQEYHLYRALYIAKMLGVEAYGVPSDYHIYAGQASREVREVLARVKDFFTTIFKLTPTYLGEEISLDSNGDITNDTFNKVVKIKNVDEFLAIDTGYIHFGRESCSSCRAFMPILSEIANQKNITVYYFDTGYFRENALLTEDELQTFFSEYQVISVPIVIEIRDGQTNDTYVPMFNEERDNTDVVKSTLIDFIESTSTLKGE